MFIMTHEQMYNRVATVTASFLEEAGLLRSSLQKMFQTDQIDTIEILPDTYYYNLKKDIPGTVVKSTSWRMSLMNVYCSHKDIRAAVEPKASFFYVQANSGISFIISLLLKHVDKNGCNDDRFSGKNARVVITGRRLANPDMSYEDVLDYVERDEELVYSNEALSYFEIDQAFEFDRSTIEGGERYGYSDAEFKEYFDGVFSWLRKDHYNAYRNDSEEDMEKLSLEEFEQRYQTYDFNSIKNSYFVQCIIEHYNKEQEPGIIAICDKTIVDYYGLEIMLLINALMGNDFTQSKIWRKGTK